MFMCIFYNGLFKKIGVSLHCDLNLLTESPAGLGRRVFLGRLAMTSMILALGRQQCCSGLY
jgi:hypothetical protein